MPTPPSICGAAGGDIDEILKGAKSAEMPIDQSSHYKWLMNLKIANALAVNIPPC